VGSAPDIGSEQSDDENDSDGPRGKGLDWLLAQFLGLLVEIDSAHWREWELLQLADSLRLISHDTPRYPNRGTGVAE
jgi:hypothetical protein